MSDVLRAFFSRLRAIFSNTQMEDDFKEELAAHVDLLTSENEKGGMTPDGAAVVPDAGERGGFKTDYHD